MIYKTDVPEMPSIKEAVFIANILDEAGLYDDASLMDEFIKIASQEKEIEKFAGLWSGIWNRIGGLTKRLFFKEYRQLYSKAKEAHEKVAERMDEIEKHYKEAKKLIKNYDLVSWRETVLAMPIKTDDLMTDFEAAFGNLVAFTFKLQDKEKIPGKEFNISNITPPGKSPEKKELGKEVGKETEVKKELSKDTRVFKERGWSWADPTIKSIAKNDLTSEIAIEKGKYDDYYRKHIVDTSTDPDKNYVKLSSHSKGYPKGLKEALGENTWQLTSSDTDWVYLLKVEPKEEQISPMKPVGEDFPQPKRVPYDLDKLKRDYETYERTGKKPKEEVEREKAEKVELEKQKTMEEPEEMEEENEYEKMVEKNKGKVWASYRLGSGSGRFVLINPNQLKPGMSLVEEPELIDKLNKKLFEESYKGKRRQKVFTLPSEK